jgi:predicted ribosome quality control (RQC) complex YloA/Tae2 family protein
MVRQKIVDLKSKLILFEKMDLNDLRNYEKNMIQTENEQRGSYRDEVKVRRFFIDEKWEVLVGKDSENNDILTVKVAKQNDYWFHARGSSGSHVVLRFNGKEKPPKDIIKKTAQIAAFYSKAKNSKIVPVCYTQKKYVVKRKGMDPGQVSLLREDVVMVAPVLPEGCISDSAE